MVHQDPQPRVRARTELLDDRREVVDALQVLHDHALDAQVVAPHLLDQFGVVPPLDVDAPGACHPRACARDGHRTGRRTGRPGRTGGGPHQRHHAPLPQEATRLQGEHPVLAEALVEDLPEGFDPEERGTVSTVLSTLLETLVEENEERLMIGGTANLTRFGHDFPLVIRPVLEALEEQVVLLKLLGEAKDPGVTVRIGHENAHEGLNSTSVVSVGYGSGGEAVAKLGVVGPTRMDYPGTMGAVRAVARYVGQILAES
ncbi:Heat-inducible transcription repressor HrcA [Streptomyces hirsutus]